MVSIKTCKQCKNKDKETLYYYCKIYNWIISRPLGDKQRLCDDDE